MLFSEKIRMLRTSARLTQEEVAKKIGVSMRSYASYEHGTFPKKREVYDKIAALYSVDKDYLLVEDDKTEKLIQIEDKDNLSSSIVAQVASILQDKNFSKEQKNDFIQSIINIYFDSERSLA